MKSDREAFLALLSYCFPTVLHCSPLLSIVFPLTVLEENAFDWKVLVRANEAADIGEPSIVGIKFIRHF